MDRYFKSQDELDAKSSETQTLLSEERETPKTVIPVGMYSLQVLVIEARDLKYKSGDVGAINPFCEVALMPFDLKQRTSLKTNTFNARFDETLRFNFKIADTQELKIGRIKICMFHYGKISQVFLGSFIIGMEELYLKPGHEMFRKWIALSDINADSVVRGYLKVSAFLLGPNDVQVSHPEDEIEGDVVKNCEYSKEMKLKTWGLKSTLFRAEHLPATTNASLYRKNVCDPFVTLDFDGTHQEESKSEVVPQTQNPVWNSAVLSLRFTVPTLSIPNAAVQVAIHDGDSTICTSHIGLDVLARDRDFILTADKVLSEFFHRKSGAKKKLSFMNARQLSNTFEITIGLCLRHRTSKKLLRIIRIDDEERLLITKDITNVGSASSIDLLTDAKNVSQTPNLISADVIVSKKDYKEYWLLPPVFSALPFWLNFYGGDLHSAVGRKKGWKYTGRLCLTLGLFESEAKELVGQRDEGLYYEIKHALDLANTVPPAQEYRLLVRPSTCVVYGDAGKDIGLTISIGNYSWNCHATLTKSGCDFSSSFLDTILTLPIRGAEIPDLFIYLERGSKKIAFARFEMNSLFAGIDQGQITSRRASWYCLESFDSVIGYQLLSSFAFGPSHLSWSTTVADMAVKTTVERGYYAWFHIFQGFNIFTSPGDAKVDIQFGSLGSSSGLRKGSMHPIWNESIGFKLNLPVPSHLDKAVPILLTVGSKSSTQTCWVTPADCFESEFIVKPYKLNNGGILHACIQIYQDDCINPDPKPEHMSMVQFDGYSKLNPILVPPELFPQPVTILIEFLGLRDISALIIGDPYLIVEIGGVSSRMSTSPYISGNNYTFGEGNMPVLKLETKILFSSFYTPAINIECRHGGILNLLLGRGSMPLSVDMFISDSSLDTVSVASSLTQSSATTMSSVKDLYNPDQDLSGFGIEDDDIPGVAKPVEAVLDPKEVKDSVYGKENLDNGDKSFFGSRAQRLDFIENVDEGGIVVDINLPNVSGKIEDSHVTSYVPLRLRNSANVATQPSSVQSSSAQSMSAQSSLSSVNSAESEAGSATSYKPLRERNVIIPKSNLNSEHLVMINEEEKNDSAKAKKDKKQVSFQDFLKINRRPENFVENEIELTSGTVRNSHKNLSKLKSEEENDTGDSRWYVKSRLAVDNPLEKLPVLISLLPPPSRTPNSREEMLCVAVEMVYQTILESHRPSSSADNEYSLQLNANDRKKERIFLHSKAEVLMKSLHGEKLFFYNGPFSTSVRSAFLVRDSEMEKKINKGVAKRPISLVFPTTVPLLHTNAICWITGICIHCGLDGISSNCSCYNVFGYDAGKNDKLTVTLSFEDKPTWRAACHHPFCWLGKKGNLKMSQPIELSDLFSFPDNFENLNLKNLITQNLVSSPYTPCTLFKNSGKGNVGSLKAKISLVKGWERFDTLSRKIITPQIVKRDDYKVRLYILRGIDLPPKQHRSLNPYLKIALGGTTINTNKSSDAPVYFDRLNHKELSWATSNPDFSKHGCFEFNCSIPGESMLEIAVWDFNNFGVDDCIGTTLIDLEERITCPAWMQQYPPLIERRYLTGSTNFSSQGKLEMWVEILSASSPWYPVLDIIPPPPSQWELRVIIYDCEGIPNHDDFTDANDLYVRVQVEGGQWHETDIHLRARDGKGGFNWRIKIPIQLPLLNGLSDRLKLQVWDKDLLDSDDPIAEAYLDMRPAFRKALRTHKRVVLHNDWKLTEPESMQWMKLNHPNVSHGQGRIRFSAELLPAKMAESLQNGSGQTAPNRYPFLPPPEGRPEWNWMKPHLILLNIIGPDLFSKLQRYICLPVVGIPLFILLGYLLQLMMATFGM